MRPILLSLAVVPALAGPPQRNSDNHCFAGVETVAFHCALANGKWIDICADAQSASPTFFQYRFGAKGKVELAKPDIDRMNSSSWRYEETAMARGMQRTAAFDNDGYEYMVYVSEAGMDTSAGVTIQKESKVLASLTCANQTFTDHLSVMEGKTGGSYGTVLAMSGLQADERLLDGRKGPFGPSTDCAFAVTERGPASNFFGVLKCGERMESVGPLAGYSGFELEALVPVDVDGDGAVEMAVVGQYMTGIGPEGATPFPQWTVVTWDGTALALNEVLAAKVEAVWTSGDEAGAITRLKKKYGAP